MCGVGVSATLWQGWHPDSDLAILSVMIENSYLQLPEFGRGKITRFAPSPTGYLHLGHAYSALLAWHGSGQNPAQFLLRIDDLDHTRSRPEYELAIFEELRFLGIEWEAAPRKQSNCLNRYQLYLDQLIETGLVYACFLSRRQIEDSLSAPHHPPRFAPSTRQLMTDEERTAKLAHGNHAVWRLDAERASQIAGSIYWTDSQGLTHLVNPAEFGDVIIGRRDIPASYHLSVVIDDADSDIELVVRGEDLRDSTPIHRLLQALLDLPSPHYHHHQLICDEQGRRLAKRHDAMSIRKMRETGMSRAQIINQIEQNLIANDTKIEKNT